jgi:hypothetical protein
MVSVPTDEPHRFADPSPNEFQMKRFSNARQRLQRRLRPLLVDRRIYATAFRPAEVQTQLAALLPQQSQPFADNPRGLLPKRERLAQLNGRVWGSGFELWKLTPFGIERAAVVTGGFAPLAGRTWIVVQVDFLKGWYRQLVVLTLLPLLAISRTDELFAIAVGLAFHLVGFAVEYWRARTHGRFLRRTLEATLLADEFALATAPRVLITARTWPPPGPAPLTNETIAEPGD